MAAGYSGKSTADKLGLKQGHRVCLLGWEEPYNSLIEGLPDGLRFTPAVEESDLVHCFVFWQTDLKSAVPELTKLRKGSALRVSWPKKTAKVPTDITEQTLRDVLLPTGLVDVKVCAVNEVWSGLKFLWRKENRL